MLPLDTKTDVVAVIVIMFIIIIMMIIHDDNNGCHVYHGDHIRDFVDCTILIGRFRAVIFASNQRGRSTEKVHFLSWFCLSIKKVEIDNPVDNHKR